MHIKSSSFINLRHTKKEKKHFFFKCRVKPGIEEDQSDQSEMI